MKRHIERNRYHAIDWPVHSELLITDLWARFPELVIGKHLVNTSYDSGFVTLSDAEREEGWRMVGQLAHSPQIRNIVQIPHDQYDEWLVFERPTQVESFETMVNNCGFSPVEFGWEEKLERFWEQVISLNPLHVLGENDGMYLVSRDGELIRRILEANE